MSEKQLSKPFGHRIQAQEDEQTKHNQIEIKFTIAGSGQFVDSIESVVEKVFRLVKVSVKTVY